MDSKTKVDYELLSTATFAFNTVLGKAFGIIFQESLMISTSLFFSLVFQNVDTFIELFLEDLALSTFRDQDIKKL